MLVNRAIELARELRLSSWLLRQRSARAGEREGGRAPVVLVPPFLGTRLVDSRRRTVWGQTRRLFFGPRIAEMSDLHTDGLLEDLPIVPGLYAQDVHGGMVRFLVNVGGYRRGEDLFVLEYDWREGVAHAAARLAELVDRIRGIGNERVDLLCVSSGGAIGRYFMAYGGADVAGEPPAPGEEPSTARRDPAPSADPAALVRRVVYVAAPQRGTFGALSQLHEGVVFAPCGKLFAPRDIAACQTTFDFLPHPDDPLFVDERGRTLNLDLYKADVWTALGLAGGLAGIDRRDFQAKLARGKRTHRALDRASIAHPDTIVIGARHQPTRSRVLVTRGRAVIPPCCPDPADPYVGYLYEPGDGSLPGASMLAAPGLAENEERLWLVSPPEHHLMPADPEVHRLVLEALLASERRIAAARAAIKNSQSLVRSSRAGVPPTSREGVDDRSGEG